MNGNSNSSLIGTMLFPTVNLVYNGNFQRQKTNSKIIAYTVEFSGSSDTQMEITDGYQFQPAGAPTIELVQ